MWTVQRCHLSEVFLCLGVEWKWKGGRWRWLSRSTRCVSKSVPGTRCVIQTNLPTTRNCEQPLQAFITQIWIFTFAVSTLSQTLFRRWLKLVRPLRQQIGWQHRKKRGHLRRRWLCDKLSFMEPFIHVPVSSARVYPCPRLSLSHAKIFLLSNLLEIEPIKIWKRKTNYVLSSIW